MYYKSKGYKYVKILSAANACNKCYPLNNKKYEIDKALELMPIPNRKCTNSQYDYENEEDLIGFCRCLLHTYDPQFEKYERQFEDATKKAAEEERRALKKKRAEEIAKDLRINPFE